MAMVRWKSLQKGELWFENPPQESRATLRGETLGRSVVPFWWRFLVSWALSSRPLNETTNQDSCFLGAKRLAPLDFQVEARQFGCQGKVLLHAENGFKFRRKQD